MTSCGVYLRIRAERSHKFSHACGVMLLAC